MDKVDETLNDLKNYTHTLVTEEMNLGNLIEAAVKNMVDQENREEDEDIEDIDNLGDELEKLTYISMFCNDTKVSDGKLTGDPTETAFIEHNQFLEDESDLDEITYENMAKGEEV